MKKLLKFIMIAAVALTGCAKSYFDINTNPNSSTNASVDLVLGNALKITGAGNTTGGQIGNYNFLCEWMGYWAPSGSYALSSNDGASYKETTGFGDGLWQALYHNLKDYDYVEQTATAAGQYFYIAAAKTMKAFVFQQLVDMFNNVPYGDAFKGTALLQPTYANAQTIYEDLATQLGTAVTLFQRSDAVGSATEDILFGANNVNWAKFANTLKLRMLIRQTQMSGRSPYIQTQINNILANGAGFLTTDAGVNPGFSNSTGKQSPFWGFCINLAGTYTQDFWRAAKYSIDFGVNNNDPRYQLIYAPVTPGNWVGCVEGSYSNPTGGLSSTFNKGVGVLKSVAQTSIIMTAAESYLLQAEAGLRGFIPSASTMLQQQALFNQGVASSFLYLGAGSSAMYTSQGGNKQTNYGACTNFAEWLACIIRQKWMAFNTTTPFEAWADYRRTGLPADMVITVHPLVDQLPARIPFRILYAFSEYQTNAANVNAMGTIDYHASKIFWMP